ncbi:hypothetical protein LTR85_006456 [Meristemomyces frigidus]|nr:hypothetical protein LTR85_006456 [Meristemomyces frigidus]
MDAFSPVQHCHARSALRRTFVAVWSPIDERRKQQLSKPPPPNPGAHGALFALGLLNLSASLGADIAPARARSQARSNWAEIFEARWIAYYFLSFKESLLADHVKRAARAAEKDWLGIWALTNSSTQPGRWHTWITSNFVHIDFWHFVANITALREFGKICSELPGMRALDMVAIALGASFFSSLAVIVEKGEAPGRWASFGASAIVTAFAAVAALGAPYERVYLGGGPLGPLEISISVWALTTLFLITDIVGWVESKTSPTISQMLKCLWDGVPLIQVGHTAHLAGTAFGVVYYVFVLWPRSRKTTAAAMPPVEITQYAQIGWIHDDEDQSDDAGVATPRSSEAEYEASSDQ